MRGVFDLCFVLPVVLVIATRTTDCHPRAQQATTNAGAWGHGVGAAIPAGTNASAANNTANSSSSTQTKRPFQAAFAAPGRADARQHVIFGDTLRDDECGVMVIWHSPATTNAPPRARLNFKTVSGRDNRVRDWDGVDRLPGGNYYLTTQGTTRVSGGRLQRVEFEWEQGQRACIAGVTLECGRQVVGAPKHATLYEGAFRNRAWFQTGLGQIQGETYTNNDGSRESCIWFSHHRQNNVRSFRLYPAAFDCEPFDDLCYARHIDVSVN